MMWPLNPDDYVGPLVYGLLAGPFVKIGWTSGVVSARIHKMQTGCPEAMHLVAAMPGPMEMERKMQALAEPDHHRGEWYRLGPHAMQVLLYMQERTEPVHRGPRKAEPLSRVWSIAAAQGRICTPAMDGSHPPAGWVAEIGASDEARLVAATIHEELRRLGYDPGETVDRWRAAGWLMLTPSGRARTSLRIAGTRGVGAYRLTAEGLRVARDEG